MERALIRAIRVTAVTWLCLTLCAATVGALASLYTGKSSELPKWNGLSYMVFCAKEDVLMSMVLLWPLYLAVFTCSAWVNRRSPGADQPRRLD